MIGKAQKRRQCEVEMCMDSHGNRAGMGKCHKWEWEEYSDSGNGYFFVCARIPIGRLTPVNFGARYGQFDLSPVSYQIVLIGQAYSRSS